MLGFGVLAYNLHKIGAKLLSNQSREKEKQEKEKPGRPERNPPDKAWQAENY